LASAVSPSPARTRRPLIFPVFGAIAEFEREIIRDRTPADLDAA
jgi:DNA invertase Pin-like site-specific DNA recombinase